MDEIIEMIVCDLLIHKATCHHTKKNRESGRLGLGLPETFAANQRSPHVPTRAATKEKA
jgi:hypothetical protein